MDLSSVIEDTLHKWIDEQTRPLDVVASWETLCDVYRTLEFTDPLSDTVRLEEFKWIIKEQNKSLTRMRGKLMSCKDIETTKTVLMQSFTPIGKINIDNRRSLAYQKLRQRWIQQMLMMLDQLEDRVVEMATEMEEVDG